MTEWWHINPALMLLAFIPLLLWLPLSLLRITLLFAPLYALAFIWLLPRGAQAALPLLEVSIQWLDAGPCSRLFGSAFCLALLGSSLMAWQRPSRMELAASYLYAGAGVGLVFSGDLPSLLLWWELLAIGAVMLLWSAGTEAARTASMRYAMVHLFGGMLMMGGVGLYTALHESAPIASFAITEAAQLLLPENLTQLLILLALLVNLAVPPLSFWLTGSYPEASPAGSVLLSAVTTKAALFAAIMLFPGLDLFIPLGLFMAAYGLVLALREDDARRVVAYSIIAQLGFLLVSTGLGTPMALLAAAAGALVHVLYTCLLMMALGHVLALTGKRRLSELGGLYRSMPITTSLACMAALTAAALPLTAGFVAKPMAMKAVAESGSLWLWLAMLAIGVGTALVMLRLVWFAFFGKGESLELKEREWPKLAAMSLFAFLCLLAGCWPGLLYRMLPLPPYGFSPYDAAHVLHQFELVGFTALTFFLLLPWQPVAPATPRNWGCRLLRSGQRVGKKLESLPAGLISNIKAIASTSHARLPQPCSRVQRLLERDITTGSLLCLLLMLLATCMMAYSL